MNLFTDDNPKTTIKGLGFKDIITTKKSIKIINHHFDELKVKQKINSYTPKNLLPKQFITNKKEIIIFYNKQKMYRILGLLNRAKVLYKIYPNSELKKSIQLLTLWMEKYKLSKFKIIKLIETK